MRLTVTLNKQIRRKAWKH